MMKHRRITDWDGAYANMAHIPDGENWPSRWREKARAFRDSGVSHECGRPYGAHARQTLDLFWPAAQAKGLVVFIHGGYWRAFDPGHWSYLAAGPLAHGYGVAMPSYRLCPEVRIADIVEDAAAAVTAAAAMFAGPIHLAGHSAGGHLVTRLMARPSPLSEAVTRRVRHVLSISGVHDLRPLMNLELNETLKVDGAEALAHSPALLKPLADVTLTCWVGGDERPEFIRQNSLLANVWTGLGAAAAVVEEPGRHHFDVVEGLADPDHRMTQVLLT